MGMRALRERMRQIGAICKSMKEEKCEGARERRGLIARVNKMKGKRRGW